MTQDDLSAIGRPTPVRDHAELPADGRLDAEQREEIRRDDGLLRLN